MVHNSRECHSRKWCLLELCSVQPAQQYQSAKNTDISLILPLQTMRKDANFSLLPT